LTPGGTDGMTAKSLVIANKCRTGRVFGNASGAIQFGGTSRPIFQPQKLPAEKSTDCFRHRMQRYAAN